MSFPFSPTDGQTYTTALGVQYRYDSAKTAWISISSPSYPTYQFSADQFDSPVTSDWTVGNPAPLAADTTNSSLLVRRFDDSTSMGVGFEIKLPSASNITFDFAGRAETAPGVTQLVDLHVMARSIPDNATIGGWNGVQLSQSYSIPTNTNFRYFTQTVTYSALSVSANTVTQFELVRDGGDSSDTLVGNWDLNHVRVTFS